MSKTSKDLDQSTPVLGNTGHSDYQVAPIRMYDNVGRRRPYTFIFLGREWAFPFILVGVCWIMECGTCHSDVGSDFCSRWRLI